jgi:hypothetical protein
MGIFGKIFGKKEEGQVAHEAKEEVARADAIIVLREGMTVPDRTYIFQVAQSVVGEVATELPHLGLSQPVWFKSEFLEAGISDVVSSCAPAVGLATCSETHHETHGPDGARAMLIQLFRA